MKRGVGEREQEDRKGRRKAGTEEQRKDGKKKRNDGMYRRKKERDRGN